MGARPYDPNTGRFLAVDPIPGGSLNNYDYAKQDAIDNYDLAGTNTSAGGGYELGSPWMRACAGLDFYPHGSYKVYVSGGRLWAVCSMHQASLLHWFKQHWGDIVQAGAACVGLGAWGAEWGTATFIPGMTAVGAVGGCLVGGGASILHGDLPDQPPWKK